MRECSARATLIARHCLLRIGETANSLGNKFNALMKQTMKKYLIFLASAALMLAVSCNKEEVAAPQTSAETELITVELNPSTKTQLSGTATTWSSDDAVSVYAGEEYLGELTLVSGSTFSGQLESASLADATEVTLHYPAGVTEVPATQVAVAGSFAEGAALLDGTATLAALRAGEGAQLSNSTALLQFTVDQAGDVTFEVGATKYTVTGCQTGPTYYACVAPASDVTFVARIGGYLSRQASKNVTFTANKIANLDVLTKPELSTWRLVGNFNGIDKWSIKDGSVAMYKEGTDLYVAKNVILTKNDYWKFNNNDGWEEWVGSYSSAYSDSECYSSMQNNGIGNKYGTHHTWGDFKSNFGAEAGIYDIYLNVGTNKYGDASVWVEKQ